MAMNPMDAISAYKSSGGLASMSGGSAAQAAGGGESFVDALKNFAGDAVETVHAGEKAAMGAANGKVDMASVVTAISNAEIVLDEIVAIRDKAIAAYKDITSGAI